MENVTITTGDVQRGSATGAPRARSLPAAGYLLLALALGAALPLVTSLPKTWMVLVVLAICGGFAAVVMFLVSIPLAPILRLTLLASFWFHMEINLFPILKYHADPPGLNISLMLLVSLPLGAAWLWERRQRDEREPVFPRAFALTLAGTLLWCSLTVAYGAEGRLGIYGLWSTGASILMCFVVAAHFSDRRALHQTLVILALIIAFNAIFGIAQALLPSLADFGAPDEAGGDTALIHGEEASRIRALSGTSNTFAWILVSFLPIVIAPLLLRAPSLRRWQRALCAGAAGLAVIVLILTYSRGSWIAFAVSLPLMAAMSALFILKADERRRLIFKFAGAVAVISLLIIPFSGEIVSRLTDDDRGAAEIRLSLIQVALAMIADNPALGVGLSGYESEMRKYDETPELVTEHFDWPVHNVYLLIAAETGYPGLLFFLALTAIACRRGWLVLRNPGADPMLRALALGLLTGMIAYLITGLKEASCFQTGQMRLFFLLCGLLLANERASRRAAE